MKIKIVGQAQVIFQAEERDPYGKVQEFKTTLELPASSQWTTSYSTAVRLFLSEVSKTLEAMEWPSK